MLPSNEYSYAFLMGLFTTYEFLNIHNYLLGVDDSNFSIAENNLF